MRYLGGDAEMAGPGDELAAGHGRMRASHADREQVTDVLKAAYAQGRLERDEFDLRVGQALAARTYADLAALTADIPAQPAGNRPPQTVPGSVNKKAVGAMTWATVAFLAILPVLRNTPDGSPFAVPVLVACLVLFMTVPTGWLLLLHQWLDKRF